MYCWKSLLHLLAYLLSGRDKRYCIALKLSLSRLYKPILSSSPHRSGPPVKISLPLHWSFSSWSVYFYSRGSQNWAEYPDGIAWMLRDNLSLQCLGFVTMTASWGCCWSLSQLRHTAYLSSACVCHGRQILSCREALIRPQPLSLHWCFLPRDSPWYLSLLHFMRLFCPFL